MIVPGTERSGSSLELFFTQVSRQSKRKLHGSPNFTPPANSGWALRSRRAEQPPPLGRCSGDRHQGGAGCRALGCIASHGRSGFKTCLHSGSGRKALTGTRWREDARSVVCLWPVTAADAGRPFHPGGRKRRGSTSWTTKCREGRERRAPAAEQAPGTKALPQTAASIKGEFSQSQANSQMAWGHWVSGTVNQLVTQSAVTAVTADHRHRTIHGQAMPAVCHSPPSPLRKGN